MTYELTESHRRAFRDEGIPYVCIVYDVKFMVPLHGRTTGTCEVTVPASFLGGSVEQQRNLQGIVRERIEMNIADILKNGWQDEQ